MPTPTALSLRRCLLGALVVPWRRRRAYAYALAVPLCGLLALSSIWSFGVDLPAVLRWLVGPLYVLLSTMAAVQVHRVVLLNEQPRALRAPRWSRDEWRYLLLLCAVFGAYWLTIAAVVSVSASALSVEISPLAAGAEAEWMLKGLAGIGMATAAWLAGRLLLVLPAVAIGRGWDLAQAWRASRGNGWRLAVIGLAVPWAIREVIDGAQRADATLVEWWLLAAVATLATAFQVTAVSLAFTQLAPANDDPMHRTADGPRVLRGRVPVVVVLVATAWIFAQFVHRTPAACAGDASFTEWSPQRQSRIEYFYRACIGAKAQVDLFLWQGERGVLLLRRDLPLDPEGRAVEHPAGHIGWAWRAEDQVDILRPASAAQDGPPEHGGVRIRYLNAVAPSASP